MLLNGWFCCCWVLVRIVVFVVVRLVRNCLVCVGWCCGSLLVFCWILVFWIGFGVVDVWLGSGLLVCCWDFVLVVCVWCFLFLVFGWVRWMLCWCCGRFLVVLVGFLIGCSCDSWVLVFGSFWWVVIMCCWGVRIGCCCCCVGRV